jgi:CRP-like cAMP-binding protein
MIAIERLQRFPFFAFMDDTQLKAVASIAQELPFGTGDVICAANTPSEALYFLTQGSLSYYMVVISEHQPDYRKEYFISVLNPEEIFGISSLIEPHIHTATLRADQPGRLIKIDASALHALCEEDVYLHIGLLKAVAKAAKSRLEMTRVYLVSQMADKVNEAVRERQDG